MDDVSPQPAPDASPSRAPSFWLPYNIEAFKVPKQPTRESIARAGQDVPDGDRTDLAGYTANVMAQALVRVLAIVDENEAPSGDEIRAAIFGWARESGTHERCAPREQEPDSDERCAYNFGPPEYTYPCRVQRKHHGRLRHAFVSAKEATK